RGFNRWNGTCDRGRTSATPIFDPGRLCTTAGGKGRTKDRDHQRREITRHPDQTSRIGSGGDSPRCERYAVPDEGDCGGAWDEVGECGGDRGRDDRTGSHGE